MSQPTSPRAYPNVKVRLRLSRSSPGLPPRESHMDIWLNGSRFRVRDEAGRHVSEILGDLSEARGLGVPARTMEDIMDVWSQSRDVGTAAHGVTELYGDVASGEGWVRRGAQAAWPIPAVELAPAAEQILASTVETHLQPSGQVTFLGRPATEYHGVVKGDDQGIPYKSEITLVLSPPYLLRSHVHDAQNTDHAFTREITTLDEDAVTDPDLSPP